MKAKGGKSLMVYHICNQHPREYIRKYQWVVEPDQKLVSVFLLQPDNRYGRPGIYSDEDTIKVSIFKDFEIDLKTVFDKE